MSVIIKRALLGGAVATLVMASGTFLLGRISGYEAKVLLESSLSGINMLCNTVILGSSTILALMLTLLSLSRAANSSLNKEHYRQVLSIAKYDTILIISAVIAFLFLNIPITESEEVPGSWYTTIYYITLAVAAILGGGLIAVVTMLYGTITNIILIVGLGVTDHPLVDDDKHQDISEEENNKNGAA